MKSPWIPLREARERCIAAGHTITRQGLVYIGLVHGFARIIPNGATARHWEIDEAGLATYLTTATIKAPEGWSTIQALGPLSVTPLTVRNWIKSGLLNAQRFGSGTGVLHVRTEELKTILANRKISQITAPD